MKYKIKYSDGEEVTKEKALADFLRVNPEYDNQKIVARKGWAFIIPANICIGEIVEINQKR